MFHIQETKRQPCKVLQQSDYNFYTNPPQARNTGGCMTMVRKSYRSSQLPTLHDQEGDVVWTKVQVGKQIYITANLYIQKQDPHYQDKITAITQRLLSLRSRRNRVFLVGDVNIDATRQ